MLQAIHHQDQCSPQMASTETLTIKGNSEALLLDEIADEDRNLGEVVGTVGSLQYKSRLNKTFSALTGEMVELFGYLSQVWVGLP